MPPKTEAGHSARKSHRKCKQESTQRQNESILVNVCISWKKTNITHLSLDSFECILVQCFCSKCKVVSVGIFFSVSRNSCYWNWDAEIISSRHPAELFCFTHKMWTSLVTWEISTGPNQAEADRYKEINIHKKHSAPAASAWKQTCSGHQGHAKSFVRSIFDTHYALEKHMQLARSQWLQETPGRRSGMCWTTAQDLQALVCQNYWSLEGILGDTGDQIAVFLSWIPKLLCTQYMFYHLFLKVTLKS